MDVIDGEWMEDVAAHPLVRYARRHDNLVVSPYVRGATVESVPGAGVLLARRSADRIRSPK